MTLVHQSEIHDTLISVCVFTARYPYERMQYNSASKLYELVDFDIDEAFPLNLPTSSTNPQVETLDDIIEEEECVRQAFDFLTQGI